MKTYSTFCNDENKIISKIAEIKLEDISLNDLIHNLRLLHSQLQSLQSNEKIQSFIFSLAQFISESDSIYNDCRSPQIVISMMSIFKITIDEIKPYLKEQLINVCKKALHTCFENVKKEVKKDKTTNIFYDVYFKNPGNPFSEFLGTGDNQKWSIFKKLISKNSEK